MSQIDCVVDLHGVNAAISFKPQLSSNIFSTELAKTKNVAMA
jgi:hypothetical protein